MLKGNGTASAPYELHTAADLSEINHNLAAFYSLEADIESEGEFTPIGSQFTPFCGTLEGNGHRISGLFMRHSTQYAGLFAWNEGIIRNLHLEKTDILATGAVGGIAGCNGGTIENCTVSGKVCGTTWVGALAGKISDRAHIQEECQTEGGEGSRTEVSCTAWRENGCGEIFLFVSPNGCDRNDGSEEKPLRTLQEARTRVRALIAEKSECNITVSMRGGDYFFKEPFVIDGEDCFHNGQTVTYRSFPGETVRCIGGMQAENWEEYGSLLRCKPDCKPTKRLWVNGKFKRPAAAANWYDIPEVDLKNIYAYFSHGWFSEELKVTALDCGEKKLNTALVPSIFSGEAAYLCGALEYMKNPGDWAWGTDGYLYYMPEENDTMELWIPLVTCLFRLEGRAGKLVENVRIDGLELMLTDAGEAFTAQGGRGKEGFEDKENTLAAVFCENVKSCAVNNCFIHDCSVNGISIRGESTRCMAENNRLQNIGYAGIHLNGSWIDSEQYINYHHRICNNEISDVGLFAVHGAGIYILGSGHNHIYRNLIYGAPRYGISIKGARYGCWASDCGLNLHGEIPFESHWDYLHSRNNLIEGNIVHDVGCNSLDGGGIEAWGPGRDNVIDYNLVYDFYNGKPTANWKGHGIFLDDATHYFRVTNNIVYESKKQGADAAVFMKSIAITVQNNIFDVTNTHQGAANISPYLEPCWEQSFIQNIVYADPKGGIGEDGQFIEGGSPNRRMYTYDQNAAVGWDKPVLREMGRNLYWNTGGKCLVSRDNSDPSADLLWTQFSGQYCLDEQSMTADPMFVNADNRDYTLRENSPAFLLGFKNIDRARMGLMKKG